MQPKLNRKFNKGFTYIGLLLLIAITGIGLSVAGMSWQYQVRAEKEKQLLFVGTEFRNAIYSYYASTPDTAKVYPKSLNDLLLDKRTAIIKRHLRKIYPDPMTGKVDWGIVTEQGRIVAVYSQSILSPFKKVGFDFADASFGGAKSYKEWIFAANSLDKKSFNFDINTTQQVESLVPEQTNSPYSNESSQSNIELDARFEYRVRYHQINGP